MAELNERDAKLVQWLNEAYAKEAELEADLTAHIALTEKASYKKRLQQHLKETRDHKRRVGARIKKLGGSPSTGPDLPGVPKVVGEAAGKAVAAVKGQVGAARAAATEQAETHMRNAQEELREEHVEIAIYSRIETLATEVGDRDTAQLAKAIRRDEERMAKFLDAELTRLVKAVVKSEIPSDQRAGGSRPATRRRTSAAASRKSGTRSAAAKPAAAKSSGTKAASKASGTKASGAKSSGAKKSGGTKSSGARRSAAKPRSRSGARSRS